MSNIIQILTKLAFFGVIATRQGKRICPPTQAEQSVFRKLHLVQDQSTLFFQHLQRVNIGQCFHLDLASNAAVGENQGLSPSTTLHLTSS